MKGYMALKRLVFKFRETRGMMTLSEPMGDRGNP
jgi:hypothetical protein